MVKNEIGKGNLSHVVEQFKLSWECLLHQASKLVIWYQNDKDAGQRALLLNVILPRVVLRVPPCLLEIWVMLFCFPNSLYPVNVSVISHNLWIPKDWHFHYLLHFCPLPVHREFLLHYISGRVPGVVSTFF